MNFDFLGMRRRSGARPAIPADDELVTFDSDQLPSWATATGLFASLRDRDLGSETTQPLLPVDVQPAPPLRERRTPATRAKTAGGWRTPDGVELDVGDVVALKIAGNPDAIGRILGPGAEGRVECTLGDYLDPHARHPKIEVEQDQLLLLLRKAGGPQKPAYREGR